MSDRTGQVWAQSVLKTQGVECVFVVVESFERHHKILFLYSKNHQLLTDKLEETASGPFECWTSLERVA